MSTLSTKTKTELEHEINTTKHQLNALDQLSNTTQTAKHQLRKYYQTQIIEREAEIEKRDAEPNGNKSDEHGLSSKSILDIPVKAEIITPHRI